MNKSIMVAIAVLLTLVFAGSALAEGKIGFVDLEKTLQYTDKGQALQKKLEAMKGELEIKMQEMELELRKLEEELRTKQEIMTEDVFKGKVEEFQRKRMEYAKTAQEKAMSAEKLRVKQIRGFINELEVVVTEAAKEAGFTMVLVKTEDMITNASLILYADSSSDLTDLAIKKLNAKK